MKSFVFVNQSCYRRQEEIARVRRFLFINDFTESTKRAEADLVIFFTCAFCQSRVTDMLGEIRRLQAELGGGAELVIGACLPKTDATALGQVFQGRTITPTDFSALDQVAGITVKVAELPELFGQHPACTPLGSQPSALGSTWPTLPPEGDPEQRMGVFIASGCRRRCSYCAIRFATGPLRSKPLEVVTATFAQGLERGYRRFELYADSLGDYGRDLGTHLGKLFEWLLASEQSFSLGIYDLHPEAFLEHFEVIEALCQAGKVHYLYLPLQSGSPRILHRMNRPCDLDLLRDRIQKIRRHAGVFLQSCVIVGFPSETEEEFDQTLAFLEAARFNDVYVHFYSDMPGTESSRMADKLPKATLGLRLARLAARPIRYNAGKTRHELDNLPLPEGAAS